MIAIATLCVVALAGAIWWRGATHEDRSALPTPRIVATEAPDPLPPPATLSALLADIVASLPANAALHMIERDAAGRVSVEIDAADPDRLPSFDMARAGQRPVVDRGIRTRFERPAPALSPAMAPPNPAQRESLIARAGAAAQGLVRIDRIGVQSPLRMAARGEQAAVLAFVERLERGQPAIRFGDFALRRDESSGAVTLTGALLPVAAGASSQPTALAAIIARKPFGAPPARVAATPAIRGDAPDLAGIVGRFPGNGVAMVRIGQGRTRTMTPGESVDGWQLHSLTPGSATFRRGDRQVVRMLDQ